MAPAVVLDVVSAFSTEVTGPSTVPGVARSMSVPVNSQVVAVPTPQRKALAQVGGRPPGSVCAASTIATSRAPSPRCSAYTLSPT